MKDFINVEPMRYWCQLVLPLVYQDGLTMLEVLSKVVKKLNELIENNKKLPDYIKEMIESYITSGAIGEVVRDILTEYMLNVKNPPEGLKPAVGDGSADDTEAIQGCIDYASANGGKFVYFPSGVYLSKPLTIKSNVSLGGLDRYSTRLVLRGGASLPLIHGDCNNVSISKISLDGNMDVQVNNIELVNLNGGDFLFSDMVLNDGYNLLNVTLDGGNFQADNLVLKKSVTDGIVLNGRGDIFIDNVLVNELSTLNGRFALNLNVDGACVTNFTSNAITDYAINVNSSNNYIVANIKNAVHPYLNSGNKNNIEVVGKSKLIDVTEIDETIINKNIVSNNLNETVTQKTTTAINNITENTKDKTIIASGEVSTISAKDSTTTNELIVNADSNVETVQNDKVTNVIKNSIENVTLNKTVGIGGNLSENVTGNKETEIDGNYTNRVGYKEEYINTSRKVVIGNDDSVVGINSNETYTNKKIINSKDIELNPTNPLTYKKPNDLDDNFRSVAFKDVDNIMYEVLVKKENPSFANVFVQESEPINGVNKYSTWYQVNGTVNTGDGVSVGNAETSDNPPQSAPYWFDPIEEEN